MLLPSNLSSTSKNTNMNQLKEQIEREAERVQQYISDSSAKDALLHIANFALEMDRWVKVEDGLPGDENGFFSIDVQITDGLFIDIGYYNTINKEWKSYGGRFANPTHWQPLPKLP